MRPSDRITFEKTHKYSTTIGKSASWIIIGLIIALFMNFGSDMLYHKNPRSSVSQVVTPNPDYLSLKKVGFFMAFGLEDIRNFSSKYIDETVYQPKIYQRTKIGSKITMEEIPVERCSMQHLPENDDSLKEYFLLNQINNLYCIKKESNFSIELQSTWDGPIYRNILLNILPCVNTSQETSFCKSSEELQGYFDNGNYVMYFTTLAVDPNNYENPLTAYGKEIYTPITSKSSTYIEMLFAHMEFASDEGILFQDLNTKHSASFISSRQLTTSNPNQIMQIDIKLDKIKTTYSRYYDKIQSVLAYMGGIINFCMITSKILVLPFIKLRFKLSLANSLFNFKWNQNEKRVSKISQSLNIHKDKEKNQIGKSYFEEKKEQKLRISYISYFCSCFRNNITKIYNRLIDKGLGHVDQMLDISYLMSKLTEIDILKVLLLNKTQRELFEYIPKPEVSLENVRKLTDHKLNKEISLIYERSNTEKASLAYNAYLKISGQIVKSELDKNLLELVPKVENIRGPKLNFVKKNSIIS